MGAFNSWKWSSEINWPLEQDLTPENRVLHELDDGNQALHKSLLQKSRIENGNTDDFDFTLSKTADFDRKSVFEDADEQDILAGNRKSADFDRKSAERLAQPPYFWEHPDGKFC